MANIESVKLMIVDYLMSKLGNQRCRLYGEEIYDAASSVSKKLIKDNNIEDWQRYSSSALYRNILKTKIKESLYTNNTVSIEEIDLNKLHIHEFSDDPILLKLDMEKNLSKEANEIALLRHQHGKTLSEIAKYLNISVNTVTIYLNEVDEFVKEYRKV